MKNLLKSALLLTSAFTMMNASAQSEKSLSYWEVYGGKAVLSVDRDDSETYEVFSFGTAKNIHLKSEQHPVYLRVGLEYIQAVNENKEDGLKTKESYGSFAAPIELSFHLGQKKVHFEPFFGVNLRYYTLARLEVDNNTTNLLNGVVKPFQVGVNGGLGLHIWRFAVRYRATYDFTKFMVVKESGKKEVLHSIYQTLTVGYSFKH